mmetsp:Transcript_2875/g.3206  ORF Transcript_2875/g.3206 Transcript_2875/m.3206 type:complete len:246 (-) Transcript_2875:70-807(-)
MQFGISGTRDWSVVHGTKEKKPFQYSTQLQLAQMSKSRVKNSSGGVRKPVPSKYMPYNANAIAAHVVEEETSARVKTFISITPPSGPSTKKMTADTTRYSSKHRRKRRTGHIKVSTTDTQGFSGTGTLNKSGRLQQSVMEDKNKKTVFLKYSYASLLQKLMPKTPNKQVPITQQKTTTTSLPSAPNTAMAYHRFRKRPVSAIVISEPPLKKRRVWNKPLSEDAIPKFQESFGNLLAHFKKADERA